MKKIMLLYTTLCCALIVAQNKGNSNGSIKAMRIAHITTALNLTSHEAEKFWPLYNEYQKEKKIIHKKEREVIRNGMANLDKLSETACRDLLRVYQEQRNKKCKISESLIRKLDGIIPTKKILLLFRSEANFKRNLLKQYGERTRAIDFRKKDMEERRQEREKIQEYKASPKEN